MFNIPTIPQKNLKINLGIIVIHGLGIDILKVFRRNIY